jgi:hypothetical protein
VRDATNDTCEIDVWSILPYPLPDELKQQQSLRIGARIDSNRRAAAWFSAPKSLATQQNSPLPAHSHVAFPRRQICNVTYLLRPVNAATPWDLPLRSSFFSMQLGMS